MTCSGRKRRGPGNTRFTNGAGGRLGHGRGPTHGRPAGPAGPAGPAVGAQRPTCGPTTTRRSVVATTTQPSGVCGPTAPRLRLPADACIHHRPHSTQAVRARSQSPGAHGLGLATAALPAPVALGPGRHPANLQPCLAPCVQPTGPRGPHLAHQRLVRTGRVAQPLEVDKAPLRVRMPPGGLGAVSSRWASGGGWGAGPTQRGSCAADSAAAAACRRCFAACWPCRHPRRHAAPGLCDPSRGSPAAIRSRRWAQTCRTAGGRPGLDHPQDQRGTRRIDVGQPAPGEGRPRTRDARPC